MTKQLGYTIERDLPCRLVIVRGDKPVAYMGDGHSPDKEPLFCIALPDRVLRFLKEEL